MGEYHKYKYKNCQNALPRGGGGSFTHNYVVSIFRIPKPEIHDFLAGIFYLVQYSLRLLHNCAMSCGRGEEKVKS
jgi:hypothetical protein